MSKDQSNLPESEYSLDSEQFLVDEGNNSVYNLFVKKGKLVGVQQKPVETLELANLPDVHKIELVLPSNKTNPKRRDNRIPSSLFKYDIEGFSPIMYSCFNGNSTAVRCLSNHSYRFDYNEEMGTLLHLAVRSNDVSSVTAICDMLKGTNWFDLSSTGDITITETVSPVTTKHHSRRSSNGYFSDNDSEKSKGGGISKDKSLGNTEAADSLKRQEQRQQISQTSIDNPEAYFNSASIASSDLKDVALLIPIMYPFLRTDRKGNNPFHILFTRFINELGEKEELQMDSDPIINKNKISILHILLDFLNLTASEEKLNNAISEQALKTISALQVKAKTPNIHDEPKSGKAAQQYNSGNEEGTYKGLLPKENPFVCFMKVLNESGAGLVHLIVNWPDGDTALSALRYVLSAVDNNECDSNNALCTLPLIPKAAYASSVDPAILCVAEGRIDMGIFLLQNSPIEDCASFLESAFPLVVSSDEDNEEAENLKKLSTSASPMAVLRNVNIKLGNSNQSTEGVTGISNSSAMEKLFAFADTRVFLPLKDMEQCVNDPTVRNTINKVAAIFVRMFHTLTVCKKYVVLREMIRHFPPFLLAGAVTRPIKIINNTQERKRLASSPVAYSNMLSQKYINEKEAEKRDISNSLMVVCCTPIHMFCLDCQQWLLDAVVDSLSLSQNTIKQMKIARLFALQDREYSKNSNNSNGKENNYDKGRNEFMGFDYDQPIVVNKQQMKIMSSQKSMLGIDNVAVQLKNATLWDTYGNGYFHYLFAGNGLNDNGRNSGESLVAIAATNFNRSPSSTIYTPQPCTIPPDVLLMLESVLSTPNEESFKNLRMAFSLLMNNVADWVSKATMGKVLRKEENPFPNASIDRIQMGMRIPAFNVFLAEQTPINRPSLIGMLPLHFAVRFATFAECCWALVVGAASEVSYSSQFSGSDNNADTNKRGSGGRSKSTSKSSNRSKQLSKSHVKKQSETTNELNGSELSKLKLLDMCAKRVFKTPQTPTREQYLEVVGIIMLILSTDLLLTNCSLKESDVVDLYNFFPDEYKISLRGYTNYVFTHPKFEYDYVSLTPLGMVIDELDKDSKCTICKKKFRTFFRKRYLCKLCCRDVCTKCSTNTSEYGLVCKSCLEGLKSMNMFSDNK